MLELQSCYVKDLDSKWTMSHLSNPYHLLLFITSGRLIYWVDDETIPLQKGDVLFVPAGSVRSGSAIEYHQRYATFFGVQEDELTKLGLPILNRRKTFKLKIQNFPYFKQRFSLLNHHWLMKGAYLDTFCNAILLEMLSMVNYDLDYEEVSSKKMKLVKDIKNYILKHYNQSIKLQELSEFGGKTPNYISCIFKEVTGFTPIEYLHDVRISMAKDMMLSKGMSIREISEETGFCDQAYFNRVFRKLSGCSPTDFLNEKSG
ncbi:AraC family transcriptional regulator [Paenibacillus radicis (ex Xue et al. 2023)]|uniref:AraC family transcriptional regulator n=1 Tax=Paenibacillus radicis (ex Xue et al. 2023) TaxID=2972489 RepID=A0ABT1YI77_9BACL|nr:AraC family transcriptional regulator [Paenibacillus radicis (ex Xue et al. 2023)]MCR8632891.1 AraC family transcriptional regulator [Paenibacillus radicis (ex Xue et al. 2023)]